MRARAYAVCASDRLTRRSRDGRRALRFRRSRPSRSRFPGCARQAAARSSSQHAFVFRLLRVARATAAVAVEQRRRIRHRRDRATAGRSRCRGRSARRCSCARAASSCAQQVLERNASCRHQLAVERALQRALVGGEHREQRVRSRCRQRPSMYASANATSPPVSTSRQSRQSRSVRSACGPARSSSESATAPGPKRRVTPSGVVSVERAVFHAVEQSEAAGDWSPAANGAARAGRQRGVEGGHRVVRCNGWRWLGEVRHALRPQPDRLPVNARDHAEREPAVAPQQRRVRAARVSGVRRAGDRGLEQRHRRDVVVVVDAREPALGRRNESGTRSRP